MIATDFPEVCTLLDLGIVPVARPAYVPAYAPYTEALKGLPLITDSSGMPQLEKIAAARPSLIIGDDWADPADQHVPYAKLAAIAPTTLFAWKQSAGNWADLAAQTAQAVGKTQQLHTLKSKYDSRANGIKSAYVRLLGDTRWDFIGENKGSWDLYGSTASHSKVATEASIALGAGAAQSGGFVEYSLERLDLLTDTDVLVTDAVSLTALRKNHLFLTLPAVKAGRVFTTSLFPASYGVATALLGDLQGICRHLQSKS